jgi:hypothetical protein
MLNSYDIFSTSILAKEGISTVKSSSAIFIWRLAGPAFKRAMESAGFGESHQVGDFGDGQFRVLQIGLRQVFAGFVVYLSKGRVFQPQFLLQVPHPHHKFIGDCFDRWQLVSRLSQQDFADLSSEGSVCLNTGQHLAGVLFEKCE